VVAAVLRGVLDVPAGFSPLQAISVLSLTIVGVIAAVFVFAAICRLSVRPVRLFTIVASIALVISWAAPLAVYFANAFPGTNASRVVGLMTLHAIAGVVTIAVLRIDGTAAR
jgi:glucan phosphoethanolaminetransferase (alkaline phosphatase superfamily)